jgi:hypothetical protein
VLAEQVGDGVHQDFHLAKRYYDLAAETDASARVPRDIALVLLEGHKALHSLFGVDSTASLLNSPVLAVPDWEQLVKGTYLIKKSLSLRDLINVFARIERKFCTQVDALVAWYGESMEALRQKGIAMGIYTDKPDSSQGVFSSFVSSMFEDTVPSSQQEYDSSEFQGESFHQQEQHQQTPGARLQDMQKWLEQKGLWVRPTLAHLKAKYAAVFDIVLDAVFTSAEHLANLLRRLQLDGRKGKATGDRDRSASGNNRVKIIHNPQFRPAIEQLGQDMLLLMLLAYCAGVLVFLKLVVLGINRFRARAG